MSAAIVGADVTNDFLQLTTTTVSGCVAEAEPVALRKPTVFHDKASEVLANANEICRFYDQLRSNKAAVLDPLARLTRMESLAQFTRMVSQCEALLRQLDVALSRLTAKSKGVEVSQMDRYRRSVITFLDYVVERLKEMRDEQEEREKRLLAASGSLASKARLSRRIEERRASDQELTDRRTGRKLPLAEEEKRHEQDVLQADSLNEEDAQMLEQEHISLVASLSDERSEFMKVASLITEIERIGAMTTSHLSQQSLTVQSLAENTLMSNEQIKLGNESLRSAIRSKSTTRFWIVFILCVLSFSLLFLDWYND